MASIRGFPFIEGHDQITIGLCPNPANQVLHPGQVVRPEIVDFQQRLQPLNGLFKSAVHLGNGPVDMGPYRLQF